MKAATFHPAAIVAIRSFPAGVLRELGKAIFELQKLNSGNAAVLSDAFDCFWVEELRIRDRSGIYRTVCYTRSPRGVLVIHAFIKKTQTTLKHDVDLGRKRLRELLHEKI